MYEVGVIRDQAFLFSNTKEHLNTITEAFQEFSQNKLFWLVAKKLAACKKMTTFAIFMVCALMCSKAKLLFSDYKLKEAIEASEEVSCCKVL